MAMTTTAAAKAESYGKGPAHFIFALEADLRTKRTSWEPHWEECARYTNPRKANIYTKGQMPGEKRTSGLYDGTAIDANEFFASSLHGLLISYTSQWFKIEIDDDDLNDAQDVQEWTDEVTKRMHSAIHDPKAKFTESFDEVCLDLGTFGTGDLSVEEGKETAIRFDSIPVSEMYLSENAEGVIDISVRVYMWTARKIAEQFPDDYTRFPEVVKALADNIETPFEVVHAIYPRNVRNPANDNNLNMRYASCYGLKNVKEVIHESGFQEFPIMCARWRKNSDEVYGRGPAMKALPDTKMLQAMEKGLIKATELIINPPLDVPAKGYVGKIRSYAGGVNYRKSTVGNERIEVMNVVGNLPIPENKAEQKRAAIRQAFYNNVFVMPEDTRMTATEVVERRAEKMQVVMPMLGRVQSELIGPMLQRVFMILYRKGKLPKAPDSIRKEGVMMKVRYLSQLAKIQAALDMQAVTTTIGFAQALKPEQPDIFDNIDMDKTLRGIGSSTGFPAAYWRTEEKRDALRVAREKDMAKQARKDDLLTGSEIAKNAGQAQPLAQGSATGL